MNRAITVLYVLCTLVPVHAHNWIVGPSRNNGASSNFPCNPRKSASPHVQVGPPTTGTPAGSGSQRFEVSWASGHTGFGYFVILNEIDASNMNKHNSALLDNYIAKAPSGATTPPPLDRQKRQRLQTATATCGANNYQKGCFATFWSPKDPTGMTTNKGNTPVNTENVDSNGQSIQSPQPYPAGVGSDFSHSKPYIFRYPDISVAMDRYVSYNSKDYPWILAVYRVDHSSMKAEDADMLMMDIPTIATGPGNYIVHWLWQGYYDCIDVQLTSTPVTNIYGQLNPDPVAVNVEKTDHCFFPQGTGFSIIAPPAEVKADPMACVRRCQQAQQYYIPAHTCDAVQVIPVNFGATAPANLATKAFLSDPTNPVNTLYTNAATNAADKQALDAKALTQPVYVCIPLHARSPAADNTFGRSEVTTDPLHPYFYSTCYDVLYGVKFDQPLSGAAGKTVAKSWQVESNCISCKNNAANLVRKLGVFTTEDNCVNCDLSPSPDPATIVPALAVSTSGVEIVSTDACAKKLIGIGYATMSFPGDFQSLAECAAFAASDPDCSMYVSATNACAVTDQYCLAENINKSNSSPGQQNGLPPLHNAGCVCWKNSNAGCGGTPKTAASATKNLYTLTNVVKPN